jgi:hypothetical protein
MLNAVLSGQSFITHNNLPIFEAFLFRIQTFQPIQHPGILQVENQHIYSQKLQQSVLFLVLRTLLPQSLLCLPAHCLSLHFVSFCHLQPAPLLSFCLLASVICSDCVLNSSRTCSVCCFPIANPYLQFAILWYTLCLPLSNWF